MIFNKNKKWGVFLLYNYRLHITGPLLRGDAIIADDARMEDPAGPFRPSSGCKTGRLIG